jgi:hypothetical protein
MKMLESGIYKARIYEHCGVVVPLDVRRTATSPPLTAALGGIPRPRIERDFLSQLRSSQT